MFHTFSNSKARHLIEKLKADKEKTGKKKVWVRNIIVDKILVSSSSSIFLYVLPHINVALSALKSLFWNSNTVLKLLTAFSNPTNTPRGFHVETTWKRRGNPQQGHPTI